MISKHRMVVAQGNALLFRILMVIPRLTVSLQMDATRIIPTKLQYGLYCTVLLILCTSHDVTRRICPCSRIQQWLGMQTCDGRVVGANPERLLQNRNTVCRESDG